MLTVIKIYLVGNIQLAVAKLGVYRYRPLEDYGAQEWPNKQECDPHPRTDQSILALRSKVPVNYNLLMKNVWCIIQIPT